MSLRAAALRGATLLSLACAAPAPAPDTLRLALINDPILNPVLAPDLGSILVNKVLFPGLVRPDETLAPAPDLAQRWIVSDDGRVYTFGLRPDVVWHDGTPFRARDVVFTFERIIDSTSGTLLWSDFSTVESVTALDSLTVRFTLRSPFAPFLTLLGHNAGILPAHAFEGRRLRDHVEFNRARPIGTGAFQVESSVPGSHLVLAANPRFHGGRPGLARIVFRIVPDVNAQVARLRAGELDLVTLEPANLVGLDRDPELRIEQVAVPQHAYVGFNQRLARFQPPAVRQALTLAVNRRAIIDGVLKGYADYPQGTIPVALRDHFATDLPLIPYDTTAALRLLRGAGWERDAGGTLRNARGEAFTIELLVDKGNPSREQAALAVQQDLGRIGIDLTIRTLEFSALVRDHFLPGRYQATLIWWNTPLDPDQFSYYATGQSNNDVRYSNPAADSLLRLGRTVLDPAERAAVYRAFQAVEAVDPPVLVLYYPREIQVRRAGLAGLPRLGIRDALRHAERLRLERP